MFTRFLKMWVWAGVANYPHDYFTPVRITNIIAFLVIAVSLLRIPSAIYFWFDKGNHQFLITILSIVALCLVPVLNHFSYYLQAKIYLITIYIANIIATCVLWQQDLYIHFFHLLAVVCCPFFFIEKENRLKWFFTLLFTLLFVSTEIYYQLYLVHNYSPSQQYFKFSSACLLALASLLCSYHIQKNINRSWQKLAREKQRSEQLLLNILPNSIAQRLKDSKTLIADYFAQASILFADIQNFTPLCKSLTPQQLVTLLNELFCLFDLLMQKHGLEKIKTSGDGYMAACGLPNANKYHAIRCCECALEMQTEFERFSDEHNLQTGLRVGIGCGEVIAGVIGKNKYSYDMWGEAVNLASRMESHGQSHKIQTTQSTYELTKDQFEYMHRGEIEVKGLGLVNTYWLLCRKPFT